ncbi:restriction endonuclease [Roseateles toxinivorans]|uniref:Restriction system protein n=1 Tax=Roseateles toxinivorans TaxID=270368 RepID=A0A4R6QIQ6_9BURK|nr:restriction endonuclease [Roseateles toxinivorans]TDP63244.1 restriction system protein [Roseateles toxinivorans]
MGRRKRTSAGDDVMALVALLPWWAGVGMAVLSYLLLHALAQPDPPVPLQPGQVGAFALRTMFKSVALVGQYVLPVLCLVGALVSFLKRRKRAGLVADAGQAQRADALDGMSWHEFEMLVGEAFRLQGFAVTETGGGGADGGVDLVLGRGSEKFLVQCKQWKAYKVGVEVVRELYGVMAARGAAGGFVVTSGRFTEDAKAFADGRNVKLVDGPRLLGLIKQARQSLAGGSKPAAVADVVPGSGQPKCPLCQSAMVKRTARKGANAGAQFWGCNGYPTCRGTRQIS